MSPIYFPENFPYFYQYFIITLMKFRISVLMTVAAALMICQPDIFAQNNETNPASAQQETKTIVPVIVNGEAQKIPVFDNPDKWIKHDLWVETEFDSDGDGKKDRMHVDVTRPEQTETEGLKLPVIYESSPYFAGTAGNNKEYFWNVKQELNEDPPIYHKTPPPINRLGKRPVISTSQVRTWLPYGFIVIHSSAPGTGLSQGCPTIGTRIEALAPKAVIDWLNGRAKGYTTPDGFEEVKAYWTTGKVGMTGTSYNGTIPFAAATTGVEGLEAIIPISPNNSYYHYYRSNGLVRSPGGYLGEDVDVLYDFVHSNPDNCAYCDSVWRNNDLLKNHDRRTGDYNYFWEVRDLMNYMKPFKAAVLMAHGFNDWNVMISHSARFIAVLEKKGVPLQVYFHQGGHGGAPPFSMMNKWFTRYLFSVQNNVENDPKVWIVRENDDRQKPTPYADYPNPDASPVKFFLKAGSSATGSLVLSKVKGQGTQTITDDVSFSGSDLAQAASSANRLLFVTEPLKEPLHISGTPSITIRASSDKPAVNLSVWMVVLPWTTATNAKVNDNLINRGWADLQNYKSLTKSKPLEPGKFYEMTFTLEPDDQIIPAGKQIGLMIFSSDREFTLWPEPGTKLTVDLDATSITIPIVGGNEMIK
jgi:X-Pro dipeptidyl-peptidase